MKNDIKEIVIEKINEIFESEGLSDKEARRICMSIWRQKTTVIKSNEILAANNKGDSKDEGK
jgi:hypothetical protein